MTSVTEDLSLDETDTSSHDIEISSQITSSDAGDESNTTESYTPITQALGKQEKSNVIDVSMEVSEQDSAPTGEEPVSHHPNTQPSERPRHCPQHSTTPNLPWGSGAQIPDLTSMQGNWYEHECFNHYWRHYHFVSMWCKKHMETYKTVSEEYNKRMTQQTATAQRPANDINTAPVFKKPTSKKTIRNRKARRRRKIAKKRSQEALKKAEWAARESSMSQSSGVDRSGETTESAAEGAAKDEDMEITDEMLDFFAHSYKHKQEREASKKVKEGGKEVKHVNIEESEEKERTEEAPAERPGSKRTKEMRLLYGKGAAMVHGMETALQMTFDRNIDVLQPRLWPNMPLRIVF